jgi:hypothetical protein
MPAVRDHTLVFNKVEGMIAALIRDGAQLPLVFLWEQMSSARNDMATRIECAKAVMPYIHRKRISELEKMSGSNVNIYQQINVAAERLKGLSDDELRNLAALTSKVALAGDDSGGAESEEALEAQEVLP